MVRLEPLPEREFEAWMESTFREYADEKVRAGNWTAGEAAQRARAARLEYLPQGMATPDHYFYAIVAPAETGAAPVTVGRLWFARLPIEYGGQGWVYDIVVDPPHRRRGYARQALLSLEAIARDLGLAAIGLHVFGHNLGARALYEQLGYEATSTHYDETGQQVTNVIMEKRL